MNIDDSQIKESRKLFIDKLNKLKIDSKTISSLDNSVYTYCYDYAVTNETPFLLPEIYTTKTSELISHLDNKNSYLLNLLKHKTVDTNIIPKMTFDELNPDTFSHIKNKKIAEETKKNTKEGSTTYTCPKCKRANSRLIERQMRSGDEPPTIFVEPAFKI
jgi:DNA-directed RNA polymerase subunit M/transcription elongation factor TFIIS